MVTVTFTGEEYGNTIFFENVGTPTSAAFAQYQDPDDTGIANPFGITKVEYVSAPTFVDIDGDGDFDAFVGDYPGNINILKIQELLHLLHSFNIKTMII